MSRAKHKTEPLAVVSDSDILRRIAEGESLRAICRAEGLAESTTRLRLRDDPALAAQYALAREAQADHYAERIADLPKTVTDYQLGRLEMDALKWAASKLAPKRYGERQQVELSGSVGVRAEELADDDLARIASTSRE